MKFDGLGEPVRPSTSSMLNLALGSMFGCGGSGPASATIVCLPILPQRGSGRRSSQWWPCCLMMLRRAEGGRELSSVFGYRVIVFLPWVRDRGCHRTHRSVYGGKVLRCDRRVFLADLRRCRTIRLRSSALSGACPAGPAWQRACRTLAGRYECVLPRMNAARPPPFNIAGRSSRDSAALLANAINLGVLPPIMPRGVGRLIFQMPTASPMLTTCWAFLGFASELSPRR